MSQYKILSLDPGLTTLGWANSVYDDKTNLFHTLKYGTYKATKCATKDKSSEIYGQRIIALSLLETELIRLIDAFKPDYIASEDIFLHPRHINAYAALVLCLYTIKRAAYMREKTVYTAAPRAIKKIVSDIGGADKLAVQKAILSNKNIIINENKQSPIEKMCEHEADCIAVGYAFATTTLPTLLIPAIKLDYDMTNTSTIKKRKRAVKRVSPVMALPTMPVKDADKLL